MCIGVLNGTVPLAVSNTSATSSAFLVLDPSLSTGHMSTTVFHLPNGFVAPATTINQIHHKVRAPSREVNIVPSLVGHSHLSTSKFAAAGYTAIYDKDEVNFYNTHTTMITVLADAVLKGWQCPRMNLWRAPLVPLFTNINTDTLILDHLNGHNSLNAMYSVEPNQLAQEHVAIHMCKNPNRSTSTTSMSSPVLSQPFGTYTVRRVSRPRSCGSRPSAGAIISPGCSSTS